jgi:hypothetical protein
MGAPIGTAREAVMRIQIFVLSAFLCGAAQAATFAGPVDLTAPGVLESLRGQRPDHYAKARAILALAKSRPGATTGRLIEARFDAADVQMTFWRVSDPPKLQVSFTLDDTRYDAQVVPDLPPARALPAR